MSVAYKDMVLKKEVLAEYEPFALSGRGYILKFRMMRFRVAHEDGSVHLRGPCLSIQLFNPDNRFLKAISMNASDLPGFISHLEQIEARRGRE